LSDWYWAPGWPVNFGPVYPLHILGTTVPCYIALAALVANIVASAVLSLVLQPVWSDRHQDVTVSGDYA
jgi:solute:Na+ symporter, SSS family